MLRKVFSECARVLVPGGKICVNFGDIHNFGTRNGGKPEIKLMGHHYQEILQGHGLRLIDIIIWKKCRPGKRDFNWSANPQVNYHEGTTHTSYRILNNTEYVYIFEKGGQREVPFDIKHKSKISKEEWKCWVDGVWEIRPVKGKKGHPAPFPEELVKRLILMYSYKKDTVLDCFGGTMTTVKVANELGRIGIGYEKEEKYKPEITKKLGTKEEDLKKPDNEVAQEEKGLNEPDFVDRLEKTVAGILASESRSEKDIRSIQVPYRSNLPKEEILIDWTPDPDEPNPSGSPNLPAVVRADDYEEEKSCPLITLPEKRQDTADYLNTIVLGDCLEKLRTIPDNSVDLLLTDPPYGIKFMGKDWDRAIPSVDIWNRA
jgi:DNA modification methylase